MCFTKASVTSIDADTQSDAAFMDTAFMDAMTSGGRENAWLARIQLGGRLTLFKLDTGTEVTAISEITHQHLGEPQLLTAEKRLLGPSRNPLQVLGQFKGMFSHNNRVLQQQVFVVKELKTNLLGLPSITALNLAARLDSTTSSDLTSTKFFQNY